MNKPDSRESRGVRRSLGSPFLLLESTRRLNEGRSRGVEESGGVVRSGRVLRGGGMSYTSWSARASAGSW